MEIKTKYDVGQLVTRYDSDLYYRIAEIHITIHQNLTPLIYYITKILKREYDGIVRIRGTATFHEADIITSVDTIPESKP